MPENKFPCSTAKVIMKGVILAVKPVKTRGSNVPLARVLIGTYAPANKKVPKEQPFKVSVWDYSGVGGGELKEGKWFNGEGFLKFKSFKDKEGKTFTRQEIEFHSRYVMVSDPMIGGWKSEEANILLGWYRDKGRPDPDSIQDDDVDFIP